MPSLHTWVSLALLGQSKAASRPLGVSLVQRHATTLSALPSQRLASTVTYLTGELRGTIDDSTVLVNNLGNQGPDIGADPIIKMIDVGIVDDVSVTLVISNLTEYQPAGPESVMLNGKGENSLFGHVNTKCGTETQLRFSFYGPGGNPVKIETLFFTFLDLDAGNRQEVHEYMGVTSPYQEAFLAEDTEVIETNIKGRTVWMSSVRGTGKDNPKDPMHLTPLQRKRAVTVEFHNASAIDTILGLTTRVDGSCGPGRNLMFSFKTNVVPRCYTCVVNKKGVNTCCAQGASWASKCAAVANDNRPHTFQEGVDVCESSSPTPSATPSPTSSPTPSPSVAEDQSCGTCVIWGDPHIITFSAYKRRQAMHPQREEFFRTREWKSDQNNVYESGKFWLVKSDKVHIQAEYKKNEIGNRTSLNSIALSGPFLNGSILMLQPMNGKTTWQGKEILPSMPSAYTSALLNATYHKGARMVKDGTLGPGIDVELPGGVFLTVNRWHDSLAAEIYMCPLDALDGQCVADAPY